MLDMSKARLCLSMHIVLCLERAGHPQQGSGVFVRLRIYWVLVEMLKSCKACRSQQGVVPIWVH